MSENQKPVLLYLHVPKTGGTTMGEDIIYPQYADKTILTKRRLYNCGVYYFPGRGPIGSGFHKPKNLKPPEESMEILNHNELKAVTGHFWFGLHSYIPKPTIYATILRHPVERLLSLYRHITKRPIDDTEEINRFFSKPKWREIDNDQVRRISGMEPEIGHCNREMFEAALQNMNSKFAVVGTIERFDTSLVAMQRVFGWRKPLLYCPRNISVIQRQEPSKHILNLLEKYCKWDLELWNEANARLDIISKEPGFAKNLKTFKSTKPDWIKKMLDEKEGILKNKS